MDVGLFKCLGSVLRSLSFSIHTVSGESGEWALQELTSWLS